MMPKQVPAVIANGQSLSGAIALGNEVLCGIAMPAAWDAAGLTFQVSIDGGTTWLEMENTGGAVSYSVAGGQYLALDPAIWRGVNNIKVRSGTSGVAVAQSAERDLTLLTRVLG